MIINEIVAYATVAPTTAAAAALPRLGVSAESGGALPRLGSRFPPMAARPPGARLF